MTADDFLAVVEKHPLPWFAGEGDYAESLAYRRDGGKPVPLTNIEVDDLCDASPAVCAAAIRLLRAAAITVYPKEGPIVVCAMCSARDGEHSSDCPLPALRAALPPEIRP